MKTWQVYLAGKEPALTGWLMSEFTRSNGKIYLKTHGLVENFPIKVRKHRVAKYDFANEDFTGIQERLHRACVPIDASYEHSVVADELQFAWEVLMVDAEQSQILFDLDAFEPFDTIEAAAKAGAFFDLNTCSAVTLPPRFSAKTLEKSLTVETDRLRYSGKTETIVTVDEASAIALSTWNKLLTGLG